MQTVIDTLASAGFAATLVALLRKRWPSLDGWYVTAVYAALAVAAALLTHYSALIPTEVWRVLQALAGIVATQGAITLTQQIASKGGTAKTIEVVVSDPTIVSKPLTIERDTTPNA